MGNQKPEPPRHAGHAGAEGSFAGADARVRRGAAHWAARGRDAQGGRGHAVSGAVPHRAARVDQERVGVSENKRRARFYKLSRTGRKQLEVEQAKWSHLSLAIGKVLRTA
jgi:hypothetical protein